MTMQPLRSGRATGHSDASDPELIERVREGDATAYEELFVRHRDVALRLARRLAGAERADDICSEAFAKILDLLQRGKGPDVAFRAYLLTTIRTVHLNLVRSGQRENSVTDNDLQTLTEPVLDDPDARFDEGAIARAFRQLPERWQAALWMTAVEGVSNEEVSRQLGIQPNAVASLAFRARAGLRQAYLSEHLNETVDTSCARIIDMLPSFLRGTLTPRRRGLVQNHLNSCSRCSIAAEELADVDRRLGALIAPVVVGGLGAALWPATAGAPAGAPIAAGILAGTGKGAGSALFGALGSASTTAKTAAIATVAAASLGVSTQTFLRQAPEPAAPSGQEKVAEARVFTEVLPPVREHRQPAARPSREPLAESSSTSPGPGSARHPVSQQPQAPGETPPPVSHTADPTADPAAAPPATQTPSQPAEPSAPETTTPALRAMAVEPMTSEKVQHDNISWHRVSVPVSDPVPGSILKISSNHAFDAKLAVPAGSGWVCGLPKKSWRDQSYLASTVTTCIYQGNGNGEPVKIDYWVGAKSTVQGLLSPPSTTPTVTLLDAVASLLVG